MTDPQPLSDADLLAWSVVLAYRGLQQKRGITILLLPFPPCPTCGGVVDGAVSTTVERGIEWHASLTLRPCGHVHTATDDDVHRILRHQGDMIEAMEDADNGRRQHDSWLPKDRLWHTEDVIREARARTGAPQEPLDGPESGQEASGGELAGRGGDRSPQAAPGGSGPREAAYEAVYAYLRSTNRMPGDLAYRNAMIWRAVHAALDAAGVPAPTPAHTVRDLAAQLLARGREYAQLPVRDFEAEGVQQKLNAILEASCRFAEAACLPRDYDLAQIRDAAVEMTAQPQEQP
jgi:hypothetical protein